ncbi:UNVERIFIED_CONTAM: hypothetical protein GTU68_021211 [Idotea baltica]|nr:hypothetical protein [Idotea baltica]
MEKKGRSMLAVRKIRQFDEDFDLKDFAGEALDIYVKLHEALVKYDEAALHALATEKAFPLVIAAAKGKTLRWAFHGSLEPPRAVLARQTHIVTKDNIFAQVTVRFLTQQTLAVYDRFGRLVHGSEHVLRDVLEYVVFEKHVSNVYGTWRVHHKIVPPWMDLQPTSITTFRAPTPTVGEATPP